MAASFGVRVCGGALALISLSTVGLAGPAAAADADGCPCSLWSNDVVPTHVDWNDDQAVELGLGFTVDVAAPITAVRFYKAEANTGPHVGSLWTADGTLLARTTFENETPSGWQQANFDTPVVATPGARYVVSYHTTSGHYSADLGYFAGGYDNGILHVPADEPDSPNGLFEYSAVPTFPTGTFNSNNYWVDVVVGSAGPVAPTVTGLTITGEQGPLGKGQTRQLSASATYSNGTTGNVTTGVQWTTSNPQVATVSPAGLVQATGAGTATITAALDGKTATTTITVTPAKMTSLVITPGTATLRILGTKQLTATATYSDGTTRDVTRQATWTSSNLFVVIPSNLLVPGHVLGLLPGTAKVTARLDGQQATTTVTVRW